VLVGVPALRNLIREDKTAQILSVIQTGAQHGMISLDQHLRELVMQGRLSRDVAMKRSSNPRLFETPSGGTVSSTGGTNQGSHTAATGNAPGAGPNPRPAAPAARPAAPEPVKKPGLFGR
jgi:hypothetical protein